MFSTTYPALQALAIRENTVYINGNAPLPDPKTQVYLDIEGLPDNDSYYLIGALVVCEGQETFYTFWADRESDEPAMFARFAEAICKLPDFQVLHFGGYEAVALKRMRARVPEYLQPKVDMILDRATNVLSAIHPHVYFPTYSNSLKEIGRFLGFQRAGGDARGLDSIVWRKSWDDNRDADIKARLVQYNQDDCRELRHISDFIRGLIQADSATDIAPPTALKTIRTEELATDRPRWELFRPKEYASEDLKKSLNAAISITSVTKSSSAPIRSSRQSTRDTENSNGPRFVSTRSTRLKVSAVPNAEARIFTKASR